MQRLISGLLVGVVCVYHRELIKT